MPDFHDQRTGMTIAKTRTTREQLLAVQARAEALGYEGDALKEIMAMLSQPPRENEYRGLERRAV